MKRYIIQTKEGITHSNVPIIEKNMSARLYDLTDKQTKAIKDPAKDIKVEDGEVKVVDCESYKAEQKKQKVKNKHKEEIKELKKKFAEKRATQEDIYEALNKLLN